MEICDSEGFPFSPLQCRQGRTRMDEGEAMCTVHAVVVLCVLVIGKVWGIVPFVYKIYTWGGSNSTIY